MASEIELLLLSAGALRLLLPPTSKFRRRREVSSFGAALAPDPRHPLHRHQAHHGADHRRLGLQLALPEGKNDDFAWVAGRPIPARALVSD